MYSLLERQLREKTVNYWPYDQLYISAYVFENKEHFLIYKPDIVNTPIGQIIRHSWIKDFSTCYIKEQQEQEQEKEHDHFDLVDYIDEKPFPNRYERGYEYFT